jgi:hypothetical protein
LQKNSASLQNADAEFNVIKVVGEGEMWINFGKKDTKEELHAA